MHTCTVATETYQRGKIRANIEHILQWHFLCEPTQQPFLDYSNFIINRSYIEVHIMQFN